MNTTGYKNTKHRNRIIEILMNSISPMTVEDIYLSIKKDSNSIVISTVYRNMEILLERGIVTKSIFNDGKARYELKKDEHIHQLICLKCNKSINIDKCPMKYIEENITQENDFEVLEHKLEIYGYCKECKELRKLDKMKLQQE